MAQTDLDKRISNAIHANDVNFIDKLLRSTAISKILSEAIGNKKVDIVKRILKIASETGQSIKLGEPLCKAFILYSEHTAEAEVKQIMEILMNEFDQMDPSRLVQTAFIERDSRGSNAFMVACEWGMDEFVMKSLGLIHNGMEPPCNIDWFWKKDKGYNVFHSFDEVRKTETRMAMIERIPFTKDLINQHGFDHVNWVPLLGVLAYGGSHINDLIDAAKLLITSGSANIDLELENRQTVLFRLIEGLKIEGVELLLKCGCKIDIYDNDGQSPLSVACRKYTKAYDKKKATRIVEYLLAFGVSLYKELYLYDLEESPDEYLGDQYLKRRSAGTGSDPILLDRLKDLRRSNKMLSLKNICRKAIRQQLKPNADEMIPYLNGVSPLLKRFLLMEAEEGVLFDLNTGNLIE